METYNKITVGFVTQKYITVSGKHICISQEFIAGDQVDRENSEGQPVKINTTKEEYQCFDMKQPSTIGKNGLKFICPKCGGNRLECCEDGPYNSEVLNIDREGDFSFGEIFASGEVERFQCLECGYVLLNRFGPITQHEELVKWIKNNCVS